MNAADRQPGKPRLLRMAVIGFGPIGELHARAISAAPNATLIALCEPDESRRAAAARRLGVPGYESLRHLLESERPDAVTIATPDHLHVEPALAAIAAGCHVFCEKPLATSVDEAERIVQAAIEHDVRLGVDFNRRFGFGYRTAKRLFNEGAIGRLADCRLTVSDRTPPVHVARHPLVIFTTLLTHHFDLMRHFGGEIGSLSAVPGHSPIGQLLREVNLSFEFASHGTASIMADYRDDLPHTVERMELRGTAGRIVVEGVTGPVTCFSQDGQNSRTFSSQDQGEPETFYDSLIAHVRAFIDCLACGKPPPVTGEDGLVGMRLAAAAVESITSGQAIEVHT